MTAIFFNSDIPPDTNCIVCWDKLEDSIEPCIAHKDVLGQNPNELIHHVHQACLKRWQMRNNSCPLCRLPIKTTYIDNLIHLIEELKKTKYEVLGGGLYGLALVTLGMGGASRAIDSFKNPMIDQAVGLSTVALSFFMALKNGKNIYSSGGNFLSRASLSVLSTLCVSIIQIISLGSITQLAGSAIFGEIDADNIFKYEYDNPICLEDPPPSEQIFFLSSSCAITVAGIVAGTIASSKGIKRAVEGASFAILGTATSMLATRILSSNEIPGSISTVAMTGLAAIVCAGAIGGAVGAIVKKHRLLS